LSATPALDVNLLTLEDAVYLLSAIRAGAAENLRYIVPFNEFKQPLGPTPDFGKSMLTHLFERKILRIHPASSPGAFEWQDDDPARLKIPEVHWGIAMGGPQLPFGSVIEQLEEKFRAGSRAWTQAWRDEMTTLWRNILLQEAIRHLLLCLEDHGFHFSPGEKTNTVLRALLEEFTLAQVWNMTWNCAKNAAAYYMRERIPKQQAANSVISRLQAYAERANSEGWEIKAARRDRRTPEPVVSQVFFTAALRIGIGYQERMPFQETLVPSDTTIN
jgi:hypothetical protein